MLRFRQKARDIDTDAKRMRGLRRALDEAVTAVEGEKQGLESRIAGARAQAAFLFGDGMDNQAATDARATDELASAESLISRGELRLLYLERQLQALGEIGRLIDGIETPQNRVSGAQLQTNS